MTLTELRYIVAVARERHSAPTWLDSLTICGSDYRRLWYDRLRRIGLDLVAT